jgi:putative transposase
MRKLLKKQVATIVTDKVGSYSSALRESATQGLHRRYHESIGNLTSADVYFRRGQTILLQRERIKRQTIAQRRLQRQRQAA